MAAPSCCLPPRTFGSPSRDLISKQPKPSPPSPVDTDPILSQFREICKKADPEFSRDRRKIKALTFAQLINIRSLYKCSQCRGVGHFEVECPTSPGYFDEDKEQPGFFVSPVNDGDQVNSAVGSVAYDGKGHTFIASVPVEKEIAYIVTSEVNSSSKPCTLGLKVHYECLSIMPCDLNPRMLELNLWLCVRKLLHVILNGVELQLLLCDELWHEVYLNENGNCFVDGLSKFEVLCLGLDDLLLDNGMSCFVGLRLLLYDKHGVASVTLLIKNGMGKPVFELLNVSELNAKFNHLFVDAYLCLAGLCESVMGCISMNEVGLRLLLYVACKSCICELILLSDEYSSCYDLPVSSMGCQLIFGKNVAVYKLVHGYLFPAQVCASLEAFMNFNGFRNEDNLYFEWPCVFCLIYDELSCVN